MERDLVFSDRGVGSLTIRLYFFLALASFTNTRCFVLLSSQEISSKSLMGKALDEMALGSSYE